MKSRGFTLVELLAIIIILAVIITIATLSVSKVISNSKEGLTEVQKDSLKEAANSYYLREGMARGFFEEVSYNACVDIEYLVKNKYVKDLDMEDDEYGSILITYKSNKYNYEYKDNKCLKPICTLINEEESGMLPKYSCKVDPNKDEYIFYLLGNNGDGTVNLIMDSNINSLGESVYAETENKGLVAWNNEVNQGTNSYGPVTAMKFLYEATKSWTNLSPITYEYNDKVEQETINDQIGYNSFSVVDGILTIEGETTVTIGTKQIPLRARLPIYLRDITKSEVKDNFNNNNDFFYGNLDPTGDIGPYGYWTLSSYFEEPLDVWSVDADGAVLNNSVTDTMRGVRPIITIDTYRIE